MNINNAKTTQNRGEFMRKPAGPGTAATLPQYSPKRPSSHHDLLRGPYFPRIDNPRQRQS
jgi:hypothetical protein